MNTTATVIAVSVAGVCSFISLVLTFFLVFRHLRYWVDPVGQTYIVRILLMVPVYALCSWFSLLVASHTIYFNLVRDCYEAFALYQFFSLLVHYFDTAMRDHPGVEEDDDATTGRFLTYFHTRYHPYPLCFLPPIIPGPAFLRTTKQFILQYVLVKPVLALIAIILEMFDAYGEGSTRLNKGYIWITLLVNISVALSLYYLVLFYETIVEEIEHHSPLYKFLTIKLLLFFIFWQTLLIDTLYYFELIPDFLTVAHHDILNNAIVCVEMVIISIANLWIFPAGRETFGGNAAHSTFSGIMESLRNQIFDTGDIVKDAKETFFPKPGF